MKSRIAMLAAMLLFVVIQAARWLLYRGAFPLKLYNWLLLDVSLYLWRHSQQHSRAISAWNKFVSRRLYGPPKERYAFDPRPFPGRREGETYAEFLTRHLKETGLG